MSRCHWGIQSERHILRASTQMFTVEVSCSQGIMGSTIRRGIASIDNAQTHRVVEAFGVLLTLTMGGWVCLQ